MPEFGLIGKNISYSFSKDYFNKKFEKKDLKFSYENFDLSDLNEFPAILSRHPELVGLNVTIPYKEAIIPYLDNLDKKAEKIGAVNTIKISRDGELTGYNTDYYGFRESLKPHIKNYHKNALILGTGGASKAVAYTFKKLKINFDYVSRNESNQTKFLYSDLTDAIISSYSIIVNCTPVGTYPDLNACPDIPLNSITEKHILYDLIYNPPLTKFLACGEMAGATVINGAEMLKLQAEKAWKIWN